MHREQRFCLVGVAVAWRDAVAAANAAETVAHRQLLASSAASLADKHPHNVAVFIKKIDK